MKYLKLIELIKKLTAQGFWGEITIKFKDGEIVLINKNEQMKP